MDDTTTHMKMVIILFSLASGNQIDIVNDVFTDRVNPFEPQMKSAQYGPWFICVGFSAHTCHRPPQMPAKATNN